MILIGLGLLVAAYPYLGYPLLLRLLVRPRDLTPPWRDPARPWPSISVALPVHNGAATIGPVLEAILAAPYPGARQILVVSDGSRDGTAEIVRSFASRGVELFVIAEHVGKTEVENRARERLRWDIIVNTDASVRLDPGALQALVAALDDPSVGVASGHDVSIGVDAAQASGESTYVGLEMRLRELETIAGGIVGASGCLYAIRASLHRRHLAPHLSRDFSAALHAHEHGYRAVSVPGAICYVPRGRARGAEYRRKVRTMTRGLVTLAAHRRLLDPVRYGRFAWMLWSHKLLRWLSPLVLIGVAIVALLPGTGTPLTRAAVLGIGGIALLGWWWPGSRAPRPLTMAAYGAGALVAGAHAWWQALTGKTAPVWEPTRRDVTTHHADRA